MPTDPHSSSSMEYRVFVEAEEWSDIAQEARLVGDYLTTKAGDLTGSQVGRLVQMREAAARTLFAAQQETIWIEKGLSS